MLHDRRDVHGEMVVVRPVRARSSPPQECSRLRFVMMHKRVHVGDIGMATADDASILAWARR